MKNLFFLCAFVFMSMQIQAQLYIVEVNPHWGGFDNTIIIYHPNGETTIETIPDWQIQQSELDGYDYSGGDYEKSYIYRWLNVELNNIISQGYKLTHINSDDNTPYKTYYLAVP